MIIIDAWVRPCHGLVTSSKQFYKSITEWQQIIQYHNQQSAAGARGPLEARGPWYSAIVPPTKDGPACILSWP